MVILDFIFLVPLLLGLFFGFSKGLINQIASIIGVLAAIYGSFKFSTFVNEFLIQKEIANEKWTSIISIVLTFLLIIIAIRLVSKLIESFLTFTGLGILNKIGGALFGAGKYAIILSIFTHYFKKLNEALGLAPKIQLNESILYPYFNQYSGIVMQYINHINF